MIGVLSLSCKSVSREASLSSPDEWRSLLSGRNRAGWEMVGPGKFRFEDGAWVTHGGMGLLWYDLEKFGNCQIRVVFKLSAPDDNSGVFIRIPEPPRTPMQAVNQGYEVQIDNNDDEWHRNGCLYSLTKAQNKVSAKVGQWSTMIVTLDGKQTTVEIDGQLVTAFREGDPTPEKKIWYEPDRGPRPVYGYVGLQNHGGNAKVHFKEVSVRPLPANRGRPGS
jgi:hypothetical protein